MLIGNRYADNKLYRGIKHYDSLPLTSGDLHEYADILQMKNAFFMNNIIGSGTLNEPTCTISSAGISMNSPSVVLIDGDISLVQASSNIVTANAISTAGVSNGLVCIVGWYQSITANSTLRAYGGVNNTILTNDIMDSNLDIQVSTRYQLRWDVVIVNNADYVSGNAITITLPNRAETGATTSGTMTLDIGSSTDTVRTITKPASMTYAVSDLYVVPILSYSYSSNTITNARAYRAVRPLGATNFIESTTEPSEEYNEGTIWYNPTTHRFKFYVPGSGFLSTASDITFMQYNNVVDITIATTVASNITISIGIPLYTTNDILQVIYNGAIMTVGQHYTVNAQNNTITLLSTTTQVGDSITFVVIRLVDSANVSTIATEFNSHLSLLGNSSTKGHVYLSDSMNSNYGVERNIAATPKSVYDATTLIDSVTNKRYRLSVVNGVLGITEISQ